MKTVAVYSSKTGTCGHQSPFRKNFCLLFLKQKKISWKWWHMLALPDTLEAEARGSLILENPDGPWQHVGITPIFLKII